MSSGNDNNRPIISKWFSKYQMGNIIKTCINCKSKLMKNDIKAYLAWVKCHSWKLNLWLHFPIAMTIGWKCRLSLSYVNKKSDLPQICQLYQPCLQLILNNIWNNTKTQEHYSRVSVKFECIQLEIIVVKRYISSGNQSRR